MHSRTLCALASVLVALLASGPAFGQDANEPENGQENAQASDPEVERRARRVTVGAVSLVGLYGAAAWWSGDLSSNFRVRSEGWFGRDTYAGGADKLGHGFSTYLGTRLFVRAYEAVGLPQEEAIDRAALATLATLMGVEVLDGFSKRFRFSPEDAVMNLSGVGLAWLLERHPELDRKLDFRLLYRRSAEAKAGGVWDPIEDTSGQTYLMAIKGAGFDSLAQVPGARYFEVLLGYGSRGYRPGAPGIPTSRHFYAGIGINLAELLGVTVFDRGVPPSRSQRLINGVLEYLQVPGTTLLHDHQF